METADAVIISIINLSSVCFFFQLKMVVNFIVSEYEAWTCFYRNFRKIQPYSISIGVELLRSKLAICLFQFFIFYGIRGKWLNSILIWILFNRNNHVVFILSLRCHNSLLFLTPPTHTHTRKTRHFSINCFGITCQNSGTENAARTFFHVYWKIYTMERDT